ncbi:MAG: lysophospholipid acyltransferase family protein [Gluconobacter sp.]|nr:lysophospholipid acyltransferase family protein [Gluconobacter cadivus]
MMSILRGVLFNLYLFWITLFMGLGTIPIRLMKNQDLALSYAKLWARAVLFGFTRISSVRIKITGQENLPPGPLLIASQHQSFFDGFIWMTLVERPDYIIKTELTRIPVVGPMLRLTGMISVDRKAGSKALRTMMQDAKSAHDAGRQIIIFPEGTRTLPGERHPIQPGIVALARQANVPVVPVATDSGLFWDRNPWLKRPGTLHIVIGQPLAAQQERKAFTKALESTWDELCTTHTLPRDPVDNSVDPENA